MKRSTHELACLLCLVLTVHAQTPAAPGAPAPAMTRHLRIEVVMEGGGVIRGVARDGRLVERRKRDSFEVLRAEEQTRFDAGIRVWFYDGLPGFLFLRYRHIDAVRTLRPVTASEMKKLDARRRSWEEGEGVLLPIQRAADPNPECFPPPSFSDKPQEGMENLTEEQNRLLERFPPPAGWTPDRYKSLQRDVVLAAREMTPSEDQWARVYPEWLEAYRVLTGEAPPADSTGSSAARRPAAPRTSSTAPARAPRPRPAPAKTAEVKGIDVGTLKDLGATPASRSGNAGKKPSGPGGLKRGGRR